MSEGYYTNKVNFEFYCGNYYDYNLRYSLKNNHFNLIRVSFILENILIE